MSPLTLRCADFSNTVIERTEFKIDLFINYTVGNYFP